jgi:hypothetical protein
VYEESGESAAFNWAADRVDAAVIASPDGGCWR